MASGIEYSGLNTKLQRLAAMMQTRLRLDKSAGRYRVETESSARQISPRLSAAKMLDWLEAGLAVMENLSRG